MRGFGNLTVYHSLGHRVYEGLGDTIAFDINPGGGLEVYDVDASGTKRLLSYYSSWVYLDVED